MNQQGIITLERRHARGYESQPQTAEAVSEWEDGQVWDSYESEEAE